MASLPPDMAENDCLTVPEIAKLLRVSKNKVRYWITTGRLQSFDLGAGKTRRPQYRITLAHLRMFLESKKARAGVSTGPRRYRRQDNSTGLVIKQFV